MADFIIKIKAMCVSGSYAMTPFSFSLLYKNSLFAINCYRWQGSFQKLNIYGNPDALSTTCKPPAKTKVSYCLSLSRTHPYCIY